MRAVAAAVVLALLPASSGKACEGEHLAPDAKMRVGSKYRPPECSKRAISKKGDQLLIHYTASLYSTCEVIDESYYEGFSFTFADGSMIKGWDQGLGGMCVFEKRKLTVPADLAYGAAPQGEAIPANATLVFEVELLGLNGKAPKKNKGRQAGWGANKRAQAPKFHPMHRMTEKEEEERRKHAGMGGMGGHGRMGGMGGEDEAADTKALARGVGFRRIQRDNEVAADTVDAAARALAEKDGEGEPKDEV